MTAAAALDPVRLDAVLGRIRPLLRPTRASPPLTSERLRGMLEAVNAPLREARDSGAFANPWAVAGLGRYEVRTAAVLAWLLDPTGSHGGGDVFARAIWEEAMRPCVPFPLDGLRRSSTEMTPLGDDHNRVDLVLEGDDFLIFFEAKIDAPLRSDQLADYQRLLDARADMLKKTHRQLILLSIADLRDFPECGWITWRAVGRAVRRAASAAAPSYGNRLSRSFADHLEQLV